MEKISLRAGGRGRSLQLFGGLFGGRKSRSLGNIIRNNFKAFGLYARAYSFPGFAGPRPPQTVFCRISRQVFHTVHRLFHNPPFPERVEGICIFGLHKFYWPNFCFSPLFCSLEKCQHRKYCLKNWGLTNKFRVLSARDGKTEVF